MNRFVKYSRPAYGAMEKQILAFWDQDQTFAKSVKSRPKTNNYVFYDGPPFITGLPHHGNLLASIAKDVIPRFKTMQGQRVVRLWGWDCHGLPAENFVEKKLGLKNKQAVLDFGLEKYITICRSSMIETGSSWRDTIERIGRWVEFDRAYKTMDKDYMESVWWAFKKLYDAGQIYQGEKVLMYCSRCVTPVSKAEVAMDNSYQQVEDLSVYVLFDLKPTDKKKWPANFPKQVAALAWTTTPWTLPANTGLAVNPTLRYSLVTDGDRHFIVASDCLERLGASWPEVKLQVLTTLAGDDLVGFGYRPLLEDQGPQAHRILGADYVTTEEGSGLVHLAPAYGEEDYQLAVTNQLPLIKNLDDNGCYIDGPWQGQLCWQANQAIVDHLNRQGSVWRSALYQHNYPHCYRCQTRIIYKAHASWFVDIDHQRATMLDHNQAINWFPDHIKTGRFLNTVTAAPDWNISRDRLWATPLPVWQGRDTNGQLQTIVVGSYQELADLSGQTLDDYHRPFVDQIEFEHQGVTYRRIDKVIDCWFESGAMPFAQYHYPFENQQLFEANFPADYIVEYVGQVRGWFYNLHALAVALFDQPAFKNVIVTGTIVGTDGRKISKSLGNYTEPLDLVEAFSADAYRLVLMRSPVMKAEDFIVSDQILAQTQKQLETLRNVLGFFLLYASADDWQPSTPIDQLPDTDNLLDSWILSCLSHLNRQLTTGLEAYNLPQASRPIPGFIDDLSNWYVRRSRTRFWKTSDDNDKDRAYQTLRFVLYNTARLLAPICPFIAEEINQQLNQKDSIHLADWPQIDSEDQALRQTMATVRQVISDGLSQRASCGIKVRQPLASITIAPLDQIQSSPDDWLELIKSELNVKQVIFTPGVSPQLDTNLTPKLRAEGQARELIRHVQLLRKKADLEVSDRIRLNCQVKSGQQTFITDFVDLIKGETLATELNLASPTSDQKTASCRLAADFKMVIGLNKIEV